MLSAQEITTNTEKLSEMMIKARIKGQELASVFSVLEATKINLAGAGLETNIVFADQPHLQAAWESYRNLGEKLELPQLLRTVSG